jgi:hypothetical protein
VVIFFLKVLEEALLDVSSLSLAPGLAAEREDEVTSEDRLIEAFLEEAEEDRRRRTPEE